MVLLGTDLPHGDPFRLGSLAARLGEWPLLLTLVGRQLQELVNEDGLSLGQALQDVESALQAGGLTAFDREDTRSRQRAVALTLEASLARLAEADHRRYGELAIFPEDRDIPLSILERLWGARPFEVRKLCERLRGLSLDFSYLRAKLKATDISALFADYAPWSREDWELRLIESALRLSAHALTEDPEQLAPQLLGRLLDRPEPGVVRLLREIDESHRLVGFRPRKASLAPPGGPLVHTLSGAGHVTAIAVLDGRRAVAGSEDGKLRLWDLESGEILRTLEGHAAEVSHLTVLSGGRLLSGSWDGTVRLWDTDEGRILRTFELTPGQDQCAGGRGEPMDSLMLDPGDAAPSGHGKRRDSARAW